MFLVWFTQQNLWLILPIANLERRNFPLASNLYKVPDVLCSSTQVVLWQKRKSSYLLALPICNDIPSDIPDYSLAKRSWMEVTTHTEDEEPVQDRPRWIAVQKVQSIDISPASILPSSSLTTLIPSIEATAPIVVSTLASNLSVEASDFVPAA